MNPISNPALIPPGGLSTPPTPRGAAVTPPVARAASATPTVAPTAPGTTGPADDASGKANGGANPPGQSFAEALQQAGGSQPLQFSRHALARVQRRGIELDSATLGRLSDGVGRAASKGSRDSLVLVDGTAFVVSVSNRTVITAVGSEQMKDNVFTNIDSAVIA
ncbi:MAG TPA: TIGR02530 family flagellar biosynthesis protein [Solirubrobacteraceae bacterium]|jgi:flagellar operon protein|nr:TIGR02530 family flagellar biosynthesis protein [Solirubrobacteraceae bacterium]